MKRFEDSKNELARWGRNTIYFCSLYPSESTITLRLSIIGRYLLYLLENRKTVVTHHQSRAGNEKVYHYPIFGFRQITKPVANSTSGS